MIEHLRQLQTTRLSPVETAIVASRLGIAFLSVDEPHHAQPALEEAATYFFPHLVTFTITLADDDPAPDVDWTDRVANVRKALPPLQVETPGLKEPDSQVYVLELLNHLGILWFNRSNLLRALCYLVSSQEWSRHAMQQPAPPAWLAAQTHAHFYLAQVYGRLGLATDSATCCLATLELQWLHCVQDPATESWTAAVEWVRNALKLIDFYLETDATREAASCLQASELVLLRQDVQEEEGKGLIADLYAQWSRVHETTLRLASQEHEGRQDSARTNVEGLPRACTLEAIIRRLGLPSEATQKGLHMTFVAPSTIQTYDAARTVFQMATRACTCASQVFVLDGYVTHHVRLVQRQSACYRHLLCFETVRTRRVAMQRRRVALLTPLLGETLNDRVYTDLLQELYFECAEIHADLFELKACKAGTTKPMTYAIKAMQCYQQFLLLYYLSPPTLLDSDASKKLRETVVQGGKHVSLPPNGHLSPKEFRAFLLGYFGLAHLCGKVTFPAEASKTVAYWRQSLKYHEAVVELVRQYEGTDPGGQGKENRCGFETEVKICQEMIALLPEKINQLVYNGKTL